jgi:hypothetical protein
MYDIFKNKWERFVLVRDGTFIVDSGTQKEPLEELQKLIEKLKERRR